MGPVRKAMEDADLKKARSWLPSYEQVIGIIRRGLAYHGPRAQGDGGRRPEEGALLAAKLRTGYRHH